MEAFNTIKNIVSVRGGPIFEFVEPLNSQLEILRILETTFELRFHIIPVKSMAVVVIVYHFLVSDVSKSLGLPRISAEARIAIQRAFAKSLNEVCLTVV